MGNREDQDLFDHIKFINEEAARKLNEAVCYDRDILTLTMEDLNEHLPGANNDEVRSHIKGLIDIFLQEKVKDENPGRRKSKAGEDLNEHLPGAHVDQVQRHIMGLINVFLQMQAGQSMDSSTADVMKAVPNVPDILTLTMEDLNELLPEERNFQVRSHIIGLIDAFLQQEKQVRQSMNSSPDDVMSHDLDVLQSNIDHTNVDMEEKPMAAQDDKRPKITNDSELHREDTDQADEERELQQRVFIPAMEHSTGPSGGHNLDVLQSNIDHTNVDMEEKPMAAQDDKRQNITNDSELHREDTDPAGEKSESDHMTIVSPMEHSSGPSGVFSRCRLSLKTSRKYSLVHMLVVGETFGTHDTFIKKLNLQIELCSAKSSNVILVFCPVVSCTETDMEAAMARVTEDKPVILVFMHHCHSPSHMTNIIVQPSRSNIVQIVHCAFHETRGLLRCQENEQAVAKVEATLKKFS